jgi:hypothetical protein
MPLFSSNTGGGTSLCSSSTLKIGKKAIPVSVSTYSTCKGFNLITFRSGMPDFSSSRKAIVIDCLEEPGRTLIN